MRQVAVFKAKYPEYSEAVVIDATGRTVEFKTPLYGEARTFPPYTPSATIRGWLGTCRKTDLKLQQARHRHEVDKAQGKLL